MKVMRYIPQDDRQIKLQTMVRHIEDIREHCYGMQSIKCRWLDSNLYLEVELSGWPKTWTIDEVIHLDYESEHVLVKRYLTPFSCVTAYVYKKDLSLYFPVTEGGSEQ